MLYNTCNVYAQSINGHYANWNSSEARISNCNEPFSLPSLLYLFFPPILLLFFFLFSFFPFPRGSQTGLKTGGFVVRVGKLALHAVLVLTLTLIINYSAKVSAETWSTSVQSQGKNILSQGYSTKNWSTYIK